MVGRGPRDQSSGQKPRARLPEVLACRAALRFKRANGREAGRAGLPRLLLNRGLNPFLGGVLDECGSEHSKSSRGHFFLKNDPRSLFGFHFPRTPYESPTSKTLNVTPKDVMLVKTVFPERGASVKNWKNTLRLFVLKCFQPV
jgi:hypothetical protein